MIDQIYSNTHHIHVNRSGPAGPYISPGSSGAGHVRYNPNMNRLEVNDGSVWLELKYQDVSLTMSTQATKAIDWALRKMEQETERERRARDNPALQKALEAIRRAEEQYELIDQLVGKDGVEYHRV
jgi:hypothetical protein